MTADCRFAATDDHRSPSWLPVVAAIAALRLPRLFRFATGGCSKLSADPAQLARPLRRPPGVIFANWHAIPLLAIGCASVLALVVDPRREPTE